jgi:hypothetical protein
MTRQLAIYPSSRWMEARARPPRTNSSGGHPQSVEPSASQAARTASISACAVTSRRPSHLRHLLRQSDRSTPPRHQRCVVADQRSTCQFNTTTHSCSSDGPCSDMTCVLRDLNPPLGDEGDHCASRVIELLLLTLVSRKRRISRAMTSWSSSSAKCPVSRRWNSRSFRSRLYGWAPSAGKI